MHLVFHDSAPFREKQNSTPAGYFVHVNRRNLSAICADAVIWGVKSQLAQWPSVCRALRASKLKWVDRKEAK